MNVGGVTPQLQGSLAVFDEAPTGAPLSTSELADSLAIAPPTFHQHLRQAEKAVLDSLVPALR